MSLYLIVNMRQSGVGDVQPLKVCQVGGHEDVRVEAGHLGPRHVEHLGVGVHWLRDAGVQQS